MKWLIVVALINYCSLVMLLLELTGLCMGKSAQAFHPTLFFLSNKSTAQFVVLYLEHNLRDMSWRVKEGTV